MIPALRFWWKQHRIHSTLDTISDSYTKEVAKARASGADAEALHKIGAEHHFEQEMAEDELHTLTSTYYVRLASRLVIPLPEFKEEGGAWEQSKISGAWNLTPQALQELRTAIRAEQKARREGWMVWLSLIVGVIGSLTGLISVWKK